jgi:formate-dependent nitrite reductase cytochrome c552 subunit
MTDLAALRQLVEENKYIHTDKLRPLIPERYMAKWLEDDQPIPAPLACVYCDAPWTPEMIELVELSGYCSTCSDSQRVIDVFCSACTRLVYRKEIN